MAGEHEHVLVDGLVELIQGLRAFEGGLEGNLFAEYLEDAAQPAASRARALAPTDDGALGASYHVKFRRGGVAPGVVVGSPLLYAPIINFGRGAVVHGGKLRPHIRRLTPEEHLVTAVESSIGQIQGDVESGLAAFLDDAIGT